MVVGGVVVVGGGLLDDAIVDDDIVDMVAFEAVGYIASKFYNN